MPVHIFGVGASFPQTSENRTVSDILDELGDYVGGSDRPAAEARARRSLQSAVRAFNTVAWRFRRFQQTITLVNDTSDYTLNASFRTPRAAHILNAAAKSVDVLDWVPYEDWARYEATEIGSGSPEAYTCRNSFQTGLVSFIPRIGTVSAAYPSVRLDYHSRIAVPQTDDAILSVPVEVEAAIVARAVAIIVAKSRTFIDARDASNEARDLWASVTREWRDFPDSAQHAEA